MTLSYETRIAMLGIAPKDLTPALEAVVKDWSARAERIATFGKDNIDPFVAAAPAVLSPFRPPLELDHVPFTLSANSTKTEEDL